MKQIINYVTIAPKEVWKVGHDRYRLTFNKTSGYRSELYWLSIGETIHDPNGDDLASCQVEDAGHKRGCFNLTDHTWSDPSRELAADWVIEEVVEA